MNRETLNLLLLVFPMVYVICIFITAFLKKKDIVRAKNGLIRFLNRLRMLWPVNLFFILLLISLLLANYMFHDFHAESYLISYGSLIVTVYFLDFLYSEHSRKSTANKRYMIDADVNQIIQDFKFGIADLFYYANPDENGVYDTARIYQLAEKDIHKMITSPFFWEIKLNLKHIKGFDYLINKNDFLNELLERKRNELNTILMRYSNLILYEDFKRVHALNELIHSFYFKQGSKFHQMDQRMLAHQLKTLIQSINDGFNIFAKWE
ncbi:hypothetical protein CFK37_00430 [Virgibacillus phasianinus]|uniref:Uncharacterized protein n=1 Tax=Virgibacillus phasianinus TaxID=2017483 RepID=A0A220TY47_9BACI|nr:hypothetical protein [Virgibacillus phasianinus]ASK60778.1 hypothetical protein CFK37_00430 [Virgibacillus phasianinus]